MFEHRRRRTQYGVGYARSGRLDRPPRLQGTVVSTLSNGRNFTIESFDIVAVCGNKVECCFDKVGRCFDIVAGVDGALRARS